MGDMIILTSQTSNSILRVWANSFLNIVPSIFIIACKVMHFACVIALLTKNVCTVARTTIESVVHML